MGKAEDRLFERWRSRGDTRALGRLFDRLAPRLLRLGVHLCGDATEAEDLVQASFLAAIEQRDRLRPHGPVEAWLTAVLTHKARDLQRRAARGIDVERIRLLEQEPASDTAERRELSAVLARAIDRVGEPYRQVLVLRLRHGMSTADVAHVLNRSPGAVRVQLHRALARLRPHLPTSLAGGLGLSLRPRRGLAEVRSTVLRTASNVTSPAPLGVGATPSIPTLGALLVSTKSTLALAAALALVLAFWVHRSADPIPLGSPPMLAAAESAAESHEPGLIVTEDAYVTRENAVGVSSPTTERLRGTVLAAEDGSPVAGARLVLHAPILMALEDAVRAHPELYTLRSDGNIRVGSDLPNVFPEAPARTQVVPDASQPVLATTLSGADGSFELDIPEDGGVLVCEHPHFGARTRTVRDVRALMRVLLWRERILSGIVVGPEGHPVGERLRLAFHGTHYPGVALPWEAVPPVPVEPGTRTLRDEEIETLGVWTTESEEDGRFTVRVAARRLSWRTLDSAWSPEGSGSLVLDDAEPADSLQILRVVPLPLLRFLDVDSGQPVERVTLIGRSLRTGKLRWGGTFPAPRGCLALPEGWFLPRDSAEDVFGCEAWAEGFAPTTFDLARVNEGGVRDVLLAPGKLPTLAGRLVADGEPRTSVRLVLVAQTESSCSWDLGYVLDSTLTDESGRFRLLAAPGEYGIRAPQEHPGLLAVARLPSEELLEIELGRRARIEVEVVDAAGAPIAGHLVYIVPEDQHMFLRPSDAAGRVVFEDLGPGAYAVATSFSGLEPPSLGDPHEEVSLQPGTTASIRLRVGRPPPNHHFRLIQRGVGAFTGWRWRSGIAMWREVPSDGRFVVARREIRGRLEVRSREGRGWQFSVRPDDPEEVDLVLDAGDGEYRGRLLDADGLPLADVRVTGHPSASDAGLPPITSVVTDEDGRFHLDGLSRVAYRLELEPDSDQPWTPSPAPPLGGCAYLPTSIAAPGAEVEIRLPAAAAEVRLSGRVVMGPQKQPLVGASLWFELAEPDARGSLLLGRGRPRTVTGSEGCFETVLPAAAQCRLRIFRDASSKDCLHEQSLVLGGRFGGEPIEIGIP